MSDMATTTGADVKEIQAWIERYCDTVTAGDFDGYRDFWTEDVVWLPPNTPIREGIEMCMEHNRPLFEYYHSVETMTAEEIKVTDDWAFVRVHYTYRGTPKPGADVEPLWEDGKGVFLLCRRADGSWVSTHCVWNSNLPIKGDRQPSSRLATRGALVEEHTVARRAPADVTGQRVEGQKTK